MEKRIKEIESQFTAFQKDKYQRDEILTELSKFSKEMVGATFNLDHADAGSLKTYDVRNHLEKMNADCEHIADELFKKFDYQTYKFNEWFRKELSGSRGEYRALKSVETARRKMQILRNVELGYDGHKAEIDLIVITTEAAFMLEVKNTSKQIHIDENGKYIRTSFTGNNNVECNIGEKMNERDFLLRKVLKDAGYPDFPIRSLVVFTNDNAIVTNDYKYIEIAYMSQLPHIIDDYHSTYVLSDKGMAKIKDAIIEAQCERVYYPEMDMQEYKETFATLLATLETAKNKQAAEENEIILVKQKYSVANIVVRAIAAIGSSMVKLIK